LAQFLVYPAVDMRLDQPSVQTFADGFLLTKEDMLWYRAQYLPHLALRTHPEVSPLLAEDLVGMPPATIWTAGFDPLRDEGQAYAAALRAAGVEVHEHCLRDQIHGFFGMGVLPGGMDRIERVCATAGEAVRGLIT
jgi:acetyl esterase